MAKDNDRRLRNPLEEYRAQSPRPLDDYVPFIGPERAAEIRRLAAPVQGKGWANLNSTLVGGGVAEMLQSVVPLARDLGIDCRWSVIRGDDRFFGVTKKFHNLLQGLEQPITMEEIFEAYLDTIDSNSVETFIASDLVVVHDPQPAALVMNGVILGNVLWRCHIDTSSPNPVLWRFLLPYVNQCAGAIFTMPRFVGPGVQVPLYQIFPCIDPLREKNRQVTDDEAMAVLEPKLAEHGMDPDRPLLAAISRYDIHKNQATIIEAFQRLRAERRFDPEPYLVFLGNTAADDPEGEEMLARLREQAGDDPDIRFWVEHNDRLVGALMRRARAFVHVSTREGFGLVVSEALWQGTPVIGSNVGGITEQVLEGQTGYVVEPRDAETIALRMAALLDDPAQAERLGAQGRELVRQRFLVPELVRRYVTLLRFHAGVDRELPDFRLNELTYSEVQHTIRPGHPHFDRPKRSTG